MIRERTFSTFDKFIIMDDVTLEDVTASTGTLDLAGPRTAALLAELGVRNFADMPLLAHEEVMVGQIPCRVVRRELAGDAAATLIAGRELLPVLWRELAQRVRLHGGAPAGHGSAQLHPARVRDCRGLAHDYDDKQIPHEAGTGTFAHQLRKGMLHGSGNRRAGPLARARQSPARGIALFFRRGARHRNEAAVRRK